jgi:hypothetical protein
MNSAVVRPAVPPIAGTLVVNVGEVLKVWSDGIFSSTLHRVINRSGRRRFSIPFFMYPSYDALIQPLLRNPDPAVTSSYRLEQLPDLPTLSETVLPNSHVASWNMLYGPRGLPDAIRKTLSDALVETVGAPQFRERMRAMGSHRSASPRRKRRPSSSRS